MLPSTRQNGVGIATVADFGAESSRPASLLCTLRTHQSPGEWQHSLPACSLALTGRDLHPLDFIKWFPLLHCGSSISTLIPARSVGASIAEPCFRFHTPLIEPDLRISRIRLSEKVSRCRPREIARPLAKADEAEHCVQGCLRKPFGRRPYQLVLGTQPLKQPISCVLIHRLIGRADWS